MDPWDDWQIDAFYEAHGYTPQQLDGIRTMAREYRNDDLVSSSPHKCRDYCEARAPLSPPPSPTNHPLNIKKLVTIPSENLAGRKKRHRSVEKVTKR